MKTPPTPATKTITIMMVSLSDSLTVGISQMKVVTPRILTTYVAIVRTTKEAEEKREELLGLIEQRE